jgi:hypothetical protein
MASDTTNRELDLCATLGGLRGRGLVLGLCLFFAGVSTSYLHGQALPTSEKSVTLGVVATANLINAQLPLYADNEAGFNFGAFAKVTPLLGIQIRGGFYPLKAMFEQAPVTGGITLSRVATREIQALPFAYFGGGYSKSQYSKANHVPSAAVWSPCVEVSVGTDLALRSVTWRAYEVTWGQTYAPGQNIRMLGISTGLVYQFRH